MSYQNISLFKAHRTRLLKLMYPDEKVAVGKVKFENDILKGITGRLWHDDISIVFSDNIILNHNDLINTINREMEVIGLMCEVKMHNKSITLIPAGKNDFEDSKIGMQLRAAVYVFILDLSLKLIAKHL
jgi:hypothetical protein